MSRRDLDLEPSRQLSESRYRASSNSVRFADVTVISETIAKGVYSFIIICEK